MPFGQTPEEWLDRVHADDRPGLMAELASLRLGEQSSILPRAPGQDQGRWIYMGSLPGAGRARGGQARHSYRRSLTDVTERRLLEERLRQQALYDSLTSLPNRVLFLDRLAQAIANTKRRSEHLYRAVARPGRLQDPKRQPRHQMGDQLLIQVAERIRGQLRGPTRPPVSAATSSPYWYSTSPTWLRSKPLSGGCSRNLGALYDLDGHEIVVTASVGVAMGTQSMNARRTS